MGAAYCIIVNSKQITCCFTTCHTCVTSNVLIITYAASMLASIRRTCIAIMQIFNLFLDGLHIAKLSPSLPPIALFCLMPFENTRVAAICGQMFARIARRSTYTQRRHLQWEMKWSGYDIIQRSEYNNVGTLQADDFSRLCVYILVYMYYANIELLSIALF